MALLVYADTDGVERSVTVGAEPVTVGRATECAIRSSDPRVSRNHARFFLDAVSGILHVEDLGSSNGVYVGQNKVQHSAVQANEIVLIGSLTFRLVSQAAMPPPAYQNVEWAQPATQPSSAAYQPPQQQWQQPPQPPWGAPTGAPAPAMPPPHAAPPAMPPPQQQPWAVPPAPPQEPTAWSQPPQPPPVSDAPPSIDVSGAIEEERKARLAAEEERDAYGARMAELHGELRTLRTSLAETQQALSAAQRAAGGPNPQAQQQIQEALAANTALQQQLAAAQQAHEATKAELAKARIPAGDGPLQQRIAELTADKDSLTDELEGTKVRLSEAEDQAKSAEARFRSADEELTVARQDLAAAEERIVSEIAAHEQRSAAELTSRVEELEVTRADLIKAEERIVELTKKVSELEERLGRF